MEHKVFVYGSLKTGGFLNDIVDQNYVMFYGADLMMYPGHLVDLGSFPGLVKTNMGIETIHGEVYGISDEMLRRIDAIEGYPRMYGRSERKTKGGHRCWVYVYQGAVKAFKRVPNNNWSTTDANH